MLTHTAPAAVSGRPPLRRRHLRLQRRRAGHALHASSARYATPFFGAPLPLSSGGVPICVVNEVLGITNGTLDLVTGDLVYDYSLISHVYIGPRRRPAVPDLRRRRDRRRRREGRDVQRRAERRRALRRRRRRAPSLRRDRRSIARRPGQQHREPARSSSTTPRPAPRRAPSSAASPDLHGAARPEVFLRHLQQPRRRALRHERRLSDQRRQPRHLRWATLHRRHQCRRAVHDAIAVSAGGICSVRVSRRKPNACVDDTAVRATDRLRRHRRRRRRVRRRSARQQLRAARAVPRLHAATQSRLSAHRHVPLREPQLLPADGAAPVRRASPAAPTPVTSASRRRARRR